MSVDESKLSFEPEDEEEPLYTDENGIPMLFDVIVPGDYLRAAGVRLAQPAPPTAAPEPAAPNPPTGPSREALEQEIRAELEPRLRSELRSELDDALKAQFEAHLEAALPRVAERAAGYLREGLLSELRTGLAPPPDPVPAQPAAPKTFSLRREIQALHQPKTENDET